MPRFSVINPDDGAKVFFEAPEGASEDQLQSLAEAALSQPSGPPMAPGEIPEPYGGEFVPRQEAGREYGAGETLAGTAEAILSGATGTAVGLPMMAGGAVHGIVEAIRTAQSPEEAANILEQYIMRAAEAGTYTPRTEAGREFTRRGAEALSSLPPVMGVPNVPGAIAAARQGARTVAPRTMETIEDVAEGVSEGLDAPIEGLAPRMGRPEVQATRQQVREAEAQGIPIMTSDIRRPETIGEQFVQRIVERIPFFGTAGKRNEQQKARVEAANKLVKELGAQDERILSDVIASMDQAKSSIINKYSGMKNDVLARVPRFEGETINMEVTEAWIDRELARLRRTPNPENNAAADWLEKRKAQFENLPLSEYDDVRARVGSGISTDDATSIGGDLKSGLSRRLYGVMNEEFGDIIKERLGSADFNKWKVGNTRLRELIEDEETSVISRILNQGVEDPGTIIPILSKRNNMEQLKRINRFLDDEGRTRVRQAVIRDLGMLASDKTAVDPSKMNPTMFAREMRRFNNVIDIFFTPEERTRMRGLRTALELTDRASKANVLTPTGQELSIPVLTTLAGVGMYQLAQAAGLAMAIGGAGLGSLAGRVYESKAIRNLFLQLGKAESDVQKSKIFSQLRKAVSAELAKAPAAPASQVGATQLRELEESDQ